ncbi:hypothetical protein niasHT_033398 [Heterodera trifolii]|uniref:Uncharacterized protein n=1 Tax=Heterodera trifolii TaxID=157864 RepID=A0ABD2HXS9_9BILA
MTDKSNITFYLAFKDVHPNWSLIGFAAIYGIITTFGVIFNSSVIVVTCLTKSFRGTVNYFLALYSFFELVHQSGNFLYVYTAFSGQNFIEYRLAAIILFIPVIGLGGITPAMFCTGIDRLIGIAFSEFHDNLKKRLYLALLTILSVSYGFCFSVSVYQIAIEIGLPSADGINLRVFRSLFCIIAVNVGGYLINLIYIFLIRPSIPSPITVWFGHYITGILINIGVTSNGPILYFTSTDYRQAFKKEFPFVFKRTSNQNQVIQLQNVVPMRITIIKS